MSRELILKSRAATYFNTSIVVLTEQEYQAYLTNLIDFNYPRLRDLSYEKYKNGVSSIKELDIVDKLYGWLTFKKTIPNSKDPSQVFEIPEKPDSIDLFEWWLLTPTGPQSCSRDIGEVREFFYHWSTYGKIHVSVGKGDEWEDDVEQAVLEFQKTMPLILMPTGYVCAETLRRMRLSE